MSAIQAFNNMLSMFLEELSLAFPDETSIPGVRTAVSLASKANARLPLNTFMDAVEPHLTSIMARDESFFQEAAKTIPYVKEIDIGKHWDSAPQGTKDAIWQYLSTLSMIGTGVRNIPDDILRQAEMLAQNIVQKIESGETNTSQILNEVITGVSDITDRVQLPALP